MTLLAACGDDGRAVGPMSAGVEARTSGNAPGNDHREVAAKAGARLHRRQSARDLVPWESSRWRDQLTRTAERTFTDEAAASANEAVIFEARDRLTPIDVPQLETQELALLEPGQNTLTDEFLAAPLTRTLARLPIRGLGWRHRRSTT